MNDPNIPKKSRLGILTGSKQVTSFNSFPFSYVKEVKAKSLL